MAQIQSQLCSSHELHTPRLGDFSRKHSSAPVVEEQAEPTGKISFTSFTESLARWETIAVVLNAGASAQALRWATMTIANQISPARASSPPCPSSPSSWFLEPPQSIDDLSLVLRGGEIARANRRRRRRRGADGYRGRETEAVAATALDTQAPVRSSSSSSLSSSLLSIQETIFHVRRQPSGRADPGELRAVSVSVPVPTAVVRCRADLPSERRRLAGGWRTAGDGCDG